MKITAINKTNNQFKLNNATNSTANSNNAVQAQSSLSLTSYPKNYYISFCRSFDEIYDKYSSTSMPLTVKDYIDNERYLRTKKDFEDFKNRGFIYAHVDAFSALEDCKTIEDVQRLFPHEPGFKDLKSLDEVSESDNEFFNLMKKLEQDGVKTLDCEEDVTVFIIKKIYLECREYKEVFDILRKTLTNSANKLGLGEILDSYSDRRKSDAGFYKPLGIKPPNGREYGAAMRHSDPNYHKSTQKRFENYTPEEINEKVSNLLKKTDLKARYSMMDAWNHCEQIRRDLSAFLIDNLNSDDLDLKENPSDGSLSIYDSRFYTKMYLVMKAFWTQYSQHKETLGREIDLALKRYDYYSRLDEDTFEEYKKAIEEKSEEIRQHIQLDKISLNVDYPRAAQLLEAAVKKPNIFAIRTQSSVQDFTKLLIKRLGSSNLRVIEGDSSTQEFKELVPEGIKEKMREVIKSPQYVNLNNAQLFGLLDAVLEFKLIDESAIDEIIDSQAPLKEVVSDMVCGHSPYIKRNIIPLAQAEKKYNEFKRPLSGDEVLKVKEALLEFNPKFNLEENLKFDILLSYQGKYMLNSLDEKPMGKLTKLLFWKEYDKQYNTNYYSEIVKEMEAQKVFDNIISAIDEFDFDDIEALAW
ncbi:MAG: hypothetical protein IJB79_04720 [Candidatus Gastranaerophilales bacterium]|nr:hypothetical protein [Candidatus Gastranaerophilales bacterium]